MISAYIESADSFSLCEGVKAWLSRSRIHRSVAGTIPDHRRVFALSDVKKERYRNLCDHQHNQRCESCETLKTVCSQ